MVSKIWDVTPLPLKRNLVPRFMKGGEVQESDEGYISHGDQRLSG
jgi:hypothetical protein